MNAREIIGCRFVVSYGPMSGPGLPEYVEVLAIREGGWLNVQPLNEDGEQDGERIWVSPSAICFLSPLPAPAAGEVAP